MLLVDWPHARLGAPFVDLIIFASSAAAAGIDPDAVLTNSAATAGLDPKNIDAVLAAHAGFCAAGCLWPAGAAVRADHRGQGRTRRGGDRLAAAPPGEPRSLTACSGP